MSRTARRWIVAARRRCAHIATSKQHPLGWALELWVAERGEEVRPEPFEAIPLRVGALFGDDEADG